MKVSEAFQDMLAQVDKFCKTEGEADFCTANARKAIPLAQAMERVIEAYDAYNKSWDDTTKTNADVCKLEAELDKAVADWRALTPKRTP